MVGIPKRCQGSELASDELHLQCDCRPPGVAFSKPAPTNHLAPEASPCEENSDLVWHQLSSLLKPWCPVFISLQLHHRSLRCQNASRCVTCLPGQWVYVDFVCPGSPQIPRMIWDGSRWLTNAGCQSCLTNWGQGRWGFNDLYHVRFVQYFLVRLFYLKCWPTVFSLHSLFVLSPTALCFGSLSHVRWICGAR